MKLERLAITLIAAVGGFLYGVVRALEEYGNAIGLEGILGYSLVFAFFAAMFGFIFDACRWPRKERGIPKIKPYSYFHPPRPMPPAPGRSTHDPVFNIPPRPMPPTTQFYTNPKPGQAGPMEHDAALAQWETETARWEFENADKLAARDRYIRQQQDRMQEHD